MKKMGQNKYGYYSGNETLFKQKIKGRYNKKKFIKTDHMNLGSFYTENI